MARLDLDAARAARAEAVRERHEFVFGGVVFELPVELPADFAYLLIENKPREAMEFLLEDRYEDFRKLRPTVQDLSELATGIARLYSFDDMGESAASAASSENGGKPSRPTSPATTKSTSAKPVSVVPTPG